MAIGKNWIGIFLVLFLGMMNLGYAEIHEIRSMREIREKIEPNTLVVFDIDNTLITPQGNLGSDHWFYYLFKIYKLSGMSDKEVAIQAMNTWNKTQKLIHIKLVEETTPSWIKKLQTDGVKTMALTARNHEVIPETLQQLRSVQIRFKGHALLDRELSISKSALGSDDDAIYKDGVLFVGESNNKGEVLARFLEMTHETVKKIILIDDKLKHIKNMEKVMTNLHIPYSGYRYGAMDTQVNEFNLLMSEVTDQKIFQLFFLGKLPQESY